MIFQFGNFGVKLGYFRVLISDMNIKRLYGHLNRLEALFELVTGGGVGEIDLVYKVLLVDCLT
jgi:hypothetical protein